MKKILALLMSAVMLACLASMTYAAAPASLVGFYDMDDTEGLTNIDEVEIADGVANFDGVGYLTADVNLTGADALTIAVRFKADGVTGAQWPFCVSSDEVNNYPKEHYIGCLVNTSINVERYNSTHLKDDGTEAGRNATATGIYYDADEWVDLVCVFPADGATIVYVDGEEVANVPAADGQDVAISNCIGDAPVFQIGKANWGGGEFFMGSIDTVAIYNTALSADQVASAFDAPESAEAPAETTAEAPAETAAAETPAETTVETPVVTAPQTGDVIAVVALVAIMALGATALLRKKVR